MTMIKIHNTDALSLLRTMPDASVDALVTDPPSGIGFMGKDWDNHTNYEPQTHKGRDVLRVGEILGLAAWEVGFVAFVADIMGECWRVLKPGAHGLVWALPRTADLTALGLRVARFEVRDSLHHVFGSGFPKSLDVSKAIDAAAGVEREVVGDNPNRKGRAPDSCHEGWQRPWREDLNAGAYKLTAPATPEAHQWDGWGTALKPAHEVWWLVRKPLGGTVASNVLEWGTGALNVDGCRVESGRDYHDLTVVQGVNTAQTSWEPRRERRTFVPSSGRWPANLLLTHSANCDDDTCAPDCPVGEMDRQSGHRVSGSRAEGVFEPLGYQGARPGAMPAITGDSGGASRYFACFRYEAKPSRSEREAGLDHFAARSGAEAVGREPGSAGLDNPRAGAGRTSSEIRNHHPTVKPVELMRWLVRLVTPPGGTVLDPFVGSGTTAVACVYEGVGFIGSELDPEFAAIARARVDHADPAGAIDRAASDGEPFEAKVERSGQTSLF